MRLGIRHSLITMLPFSSTVKSLYKSAVSFERCVRKLHEKPSSFYMKHKKQTKEEREEPVTGKGSGPWLCRRDFGWTSHSAKVSKNCTN